MSETYANHMGRGVRLALLGVGAAGVMLTLSLFASPSSASAAEGETDGTGLLGLVGSTLEVTTDTVSAVVGIVDDTTAGLLGTVDQVLPVQTAPVVQPVVTTVTSTVTTTVAGVTDVVAPVTEAVSTVVEQPIVTGVVSGLLQSLSGVPIVAPVIDAVDDGVLGLTGGIDGLVTTIVGTTGSTLQLFPPVTAVTVVAASPAPQAAIAALPVALVATVTNSAFGSASLALYGGLASAIGAAGLLALWPPGSPRSTNVPGDSFISASGSAMGFAAALAAIPFLLTRAMTRVGMRSDALPGAPVFATDITPD